jgi:hypothetical protein
MICGYRPSIRMRFCTAAVDFEVAPMDGRHVLKIGRSQAGSESL